MELAYEAQKQRKENSCLVLCRFLRDYFVRPTLFETYHNRSAIKFKARYPIRRKHQLNRQLDRLSLIIIINELSNYKYL